jgi:uncharacterized protein YdhG (YjbR/CyaY superfamily)
MKDSNAKSVDEYIAGQPPEVRERLTQIRETIRKYAPDAVESISYQMPAFKLCGKPLVYFAAFKEHIGFYATPTGHEAFKKELAGYKTGKGSVQFPFDRPLPSALIAKIVKFRAEENLQKSDKKKGQRSTPVR